MVFFNEELRLERISSLGEPLEKLTTAIDFELFRPLLNDIFGREVDKSKGGRPPWNIVLIFKIPKWATPTTQNNLFFIDVTKD